MKLYILFALIIIAFPAFSQEQQQDEFSARREDKDGMYVVIKNDGTEYFGEILEDNNREVLLKTMNLGEIYIPKHEIRSITKLEAGDLRKGNYIGNNIFYNRYFLATNGLTRDKGQHYVMVSLLGAELNFAATEHLSLGIMSSWLGIPIIGTAKYSFELSEKLNFSLGGVMGTASWADPSLFGAIGFGALTFGDRSSNITLSGGYGYITDSQYGGGLPAISIAGMTKITKSITLLAEAFSFINRYVPIVLILPGVRFSIKSDQAFQLGFAGIYFDDEVFPLPIPQLRYFKTF